MSKLKMQQEKLLTLELTRKTMEYIMGLSEENEPKFRKMVKRSSQKIVKLYTEAIKKQHKKAKKLIKKKKQKQLHELTWTEQEQASIHGNVTVPFEQAEVLHIAAS